MPLRYQLKDYFMFTRKDRIAVILILVLIGVALCLPYLVPPVSVPAAKYDSAWVAAVGQLLSPGEGVPARLADHPIPDSLKTSGDAGYNAAAAKLFRFDPNTLDEAGWRSLGVPDRTAGTILKYRSKGGFFRRPEDLGRIYGLDPELAERLMPFVQLAGADSRTSRRYSTDYQRSDKRQAGLWKTGKQGLGNREAAAAKSGWTGAGHRTYTIVDLNKADTTALIALPCIGSKLAARIILFREKLGGFYSVDQLRETYGITDSAFNVLRPWIRVDPLDCRFIALNEIALDLLKLHPYIRYELARTIISYRQEHGGFQSLDDLKKVGALPPGTYERIRPYLRL